MMRSLFSGVAGLKSHQTRMDVIGSNIANVNTNGYKSSRTTFQDNLSQTLQGSSGGSGGKGGTNPMQIGLGTTIASVDTLFGDGSTQLTGKQTDLSIQGQGMFIFSDDGGINYKYSRAGAFNFDKSGNLVNVSGSKVQGWQADAMGNIDTTGALTNIVIDTTTITDININGNGVISGKLPSGVVQNLGQIALASFNNPSGLNRIGANDFMVSTNSGNAVVGPANLNGKGSLSPGSLEMSNVDLSSEFSNMIITQRGFQANSKIITVSDEMLQELVNLKR